MKYMPHITLYSVAVYLTAVGLMFFFAPQVAERLMSISLPDAALNLLYGQAMLAFAFVAFMAARTGESQLSLTVMILTAGQVVVYSYLLITRTQTFQQAGLPLILNVIFTVALFFFRKRL